MGWLIGYGQTKRETIERVSKGWKAQDGSTETKCLAKSVRGNTLYLVMETTYRDGKPATEGRPAKPPKDPKDPWDAQAEVPAKPALPPGGSERWLGVVLLGTDGEGNWGYKDMDESAGPCEVSCPLSYLDMVPCPGGYATAWREKVRAYHAGRTAGNALRTVGTIFTLRSGRPRGPFTTVATPQGRRGMFATTGWTTYRITPRSLRGGFDIHESKIAAEVFLANAVLEGSPARV